MSAPPAIPPDEMDAYRATARRRKEEQQDELALRQRRAWELARRAAAQLRTRFGATRVAVFGSLTRPDGFTPWSDVDIAAWGIRPEDTLRAIGEVMDLGGDIELNLADIETCALELRKHIEQQGVDL